MPTLSGRETGKLSEGLRDAFDNDALEEFLYTMLDKRLADISLASSYKARVFRLIKQPIVRAGC